MIYGVNRRTFILMITMLLATAAITVRFFSLQVLSHEFYKGLAENQHQISKTLVPNRGEITVHERSTGKTVPVVTNIQKDLVYAVPHEIEDQERVAADLAAVLGIGSREILEKISNTERKWVPLKKELPESVSLAVREKKLKGIYLQPETFRFYPEKTFASHVLGFLGYSGDRREGQYGIEKAFEEKLAGKPGSLQQEKDAKGRWIGGSLRSMYPAEDGATVHLTLDRAIQFKAEQVLKAAVETHQADEGSIVIMEPNTGKLMALANFPNFNPNEFGKVTDVGLFRNRAVSEAYEPGSVFKAFTMALGLHHEAVTPDTTFEDRGFVQFSNFIIRNALNKVYGIKTMTQVLEESINTGVIFVQQKTGNKNFAEGVRKFGFGKQTGIELPGESAGDTRNLDKGGNIHFATVSFGQGLTTTPLQLLAAYGAIANGGKMMKPYLVEKISYPSGGEEKYEPQEVGQVISPQAAHTTGAMLVSVVENGHGKRAGLPGYFVAGKTGTAQVARRDGPGYDPNVTIGSFAGFAPVEKPAFAMVVKISNPKTVKFAESTAAPVFGEMASFLVNYLQIPPTR